MPRKNEDKEQLKQELLQKAETQLEETLTPDNSASEPETGYQPSEKNFSTPELENSERITDGVYADNGGYVNHNLKTPSPDTTVPNPEAKTNNLDSPLQDKNNSKEPNNTNVQPNYSQNSAPIKSEDGNSNNL